MSQLGSTEVTLLSSSNSASAALRTHHSSHLTFPNQAQPAKFTQEGEDPTQRAASVLEQPTSSNMQRSNSVSGSVVGGGTVDGNSVLSRGNTLKKKASMRRRRSGSLRRSSSRRSMKAGSVRSLALQSAADDAEMQSAFFCPVPTSGNPTEIMANRFQTWRKVLKDLITYFREIQSHYEHRSKSLLKLANVLNNTAPPPGFLASGGLDDALQILRNYNQQALAEASKAQEIEEDVILALTGLRSDLGLKIKEIKSLSGDFRNTVDREMEATRRAVNQLQEILGQTELDSSLTTGNQDPYLLRLAVDRQLERQLDEENYLHKAFLNLESSGRQLESIVVGEVQKSYNAYAGILKRESDAAYAAIEELRIGPIAMPKDREWNSFIYKDGQFVDPEMPLRTAELIQYPGQDHVACQEVRAGLLERKSKYLKSYTAGWYVLSPTHLHEFKSADKTQGPVMSLYLPEQKLGSHSVEGGMSNKFLLKGRQTGTLHRGHTWVFRAESHETMMAWYEDIKALTEQSPEERNNFVRGHSRSFSRSSQRSISSDGVVDEEDEEPFSAEASLRHVQTDTPPRRPSPGGRFPSDIEVNAQRGLQAPMSPISVSSVHSGYDDHANQEPLSYTGAGRGHAGNSGDCDAVGVVGYGSTARVPILEAPSRATMVNQQAQEDGVNPYTSVPVTLSNTSGEPGLAHDQAGLGTRPSRASFEQGSMDDSIARPSAVLGPELETAAHVTRRELAQPESSSNPSSAHIIDGSGSAKTSSYSSSDVDGGNGMPSGGHAYQGEAGALTRPVTGMRTDSVPTISNLHIPGEYPKASLFGH